MAVSVLVGSPSGGAVKIVTSKKVTAEEWLALNDEVDGFGVAIDSLPVSASVLGASSVPGGGAILNAGLGTVNASGKVLYFPEGQFLLDDSANVFGMLGIGTTDNAITLRGAGSGRTTLFCGAIIGKNGLHFRNSLRLRLQGFTLDCSDALGGSGIYLQAGVDSYLDDLIIKNAYNNGIIIDGAARNIKLGRITIDTTRGNGGSGTSVGHGIAISGDNTNGGGVRPENIQIGNVEIINPYGSGVNVSEGANVQIGMIRAIHDGAAPMSANGYAALRVTNGARLIQANSVMARGMKRGLMLVEANHTTVNSLIAENCGMEGVLISTDDVGSKGISVGKAMIINPGRDGVAKDAFRVTGTPDRVMLGSLQAYCDDALMPYGVKVDSTATNFDCDPNRISVVGASTAPYDIPAATMNWDLPAKRRWVAKRLQASVQAGDTIANTTTNTAFASSQFTLPANALKVGSRIKVRAGGRLSSAAVSPTIAIRLMAGAVALQSTGTTSVTASLVNRSWAFDFEGTVTAVGATGAIQVGGRFQRYSGSGAVTVFTNDTGSATINTTGTLALELRVAWGTADAANTITMNQYSVEVL